MNLLEAGNRTLSRRPCAWHSSLLGHDTRFWIFQRRQSTSCNATKAAPRSRSSRGGSATAERPLRRETSSAQEPLVLPQAATEIDDVFDAVLNGRTDTSQDSKMDADRSRRSATAPSGVQPAASIRASPALRSTAQRPWGRRTASKAPESTSDASSTAASPAAAAATGTAPAAAAKAAGGSASKGTGLGSSGSKNSSVGRVQRMMAAPAATQTPMQQWKQLQQLRREQVKKEQQQRRQKLQELEQDAAELLKQQQEQQQEQQQQQRWQRLPDTSEPSTSASVSYPPKPLQLLQQAADSIAAAANTLAGAGGAKGVSSGVSSRGSRRSSRDGRERRRAISTSTSASRTASSPTSSGSSMAGVEPSSQVTGSAVSLSSASASSPSSSISAPVAEAGSLAVEVPGTSAPAQQPVVRSSRARRQPGAHGAWDMPPPLMPFEVKRKAVQASMQAPAAPQRQQQPQEAGSAAVAGSSGIGTQPLTLDMQQRQQQQRTGGVQQVQQWQRQHEQLQQQQRQRQRHQQQQQHQQGVQPSSSQGVAAQGTPPVQQQRPLETGSWAAAAANNFPELYDPTWHTSPFAFFSDLWPATAAAHEAGKTGQLATRYYAFACRCLFSNDVWLQLGAALSLLDAFEDEDALLAGCCGYLGRLLIEQLLLPLAEALLQPGDVLQELLGRAAEAHPGLKLHQQLAGRLEEAVGQLQRLRGIYPGSQLAELTHIAGDHGLSLSAGTQQLLQHQHQVQQEEQPRQQQQQQRRRQQKLKQVAQKAQQRQ